MTLSQIIAAIACAAALVAVLGAAMSHRARRAVERTLPACDGDGVITFSGRMSDADYEAFKAHWQATHKPGCAHPVEPLDETGAACPAYQPPATATDSGLCARCGMYDYKHKEQPGA